MIPRNLQQILGKLVRRTATQRWVALGGILGEILTTRIQSRRLVMRSQLDCHDPRLPGTGVFDLKTRAALPVRMDIMNYKQHSTYLIRSLQGELESFEREYHDLIRSAFLKYDFQARIGNMDGILVAHHNTANIFGFRYIPLSEMDECLFGGKNRGEVVFEKCVLLLEEILTEVIGVFPDQVGFERVTTASIWLTFNRLSAVCLRLVMTSWMSSSNPRFMTKAQGRGRSFTSSYSPPVTSTEIVWTARALWLSRAYVRVVTQNSVLLVDG